MRRGRWLEGWRGRGAGGKKVKGIVGAGEQEESLREETRKMWAGCAVQ